MVSSPVNYSNDLIWLVVRNDASCIVKRPQTNDKIFSRESTNLVNKHTAKYSGLANSRIIGLQPGKNGKGVTLITKAKPETANKPAKHIVTSTLRNSSAKGISNNVYNATVKKGYRVDLRYEALGRASAIIKSQAPKKDAPAKKTRGVKA